MNKGSLYSFSDAIEIAAGDKTWGGVLMTTPCATVPPDFRFTAHRVLWQENLVI